MPICERDKVSILAYCPLAQGLLTGKFKSVLDVPGGRARTRHFDSAKQKDARHGEPGCEEQAFAAIDQLRDISKQLGHSMADIALAWCLHQPAVTSVLAGARSPQQIHDNARAADIHFDSETLDKLNAITHPVKQILGSNPDMWVAEKDSRIR
jgi:aryl-alcohol dehydrogenase-like predicted oxidoreductase